MKYVIHKWSRTPGSVSYDGPTCQNAGVVGGQIYTDFDLAKSDASKLSECNPVGFVVSTLEGDF